MIIALFLHLFGYYYRYYGYTVYLSFLIGSIILLFGCVVEGRGFRGLHKNYGLSMGRVAEVSSFIAPIILLLTMYVGMAPRYYFPSYATAYNLLIVWGGLVVFGAMAILWGVTCIQGRKFMRTPDLVSAAGVIYIIAGSLIVSFLLAFVGFILMLVSGIMIMAAFRRYGVVDLVFSYIVLHGGEIDKSKCAKELGLTREVVDGAIDVLLKEGKVEK
jgi:hypothetical protein